LKFASIAAKEAFFAPSAEYERLLVPLDRLSDRSGSNDLLLLGYGGRLRGWCGTV
jgi:hypothetical protein